MIGDRAPGEVVFTVFALLVLLAAAAGSAYLGWWVYEDRHPDVWQRTAALVVER